MSVIEEIEDQYFEIDRQYASKEFAAHTKGHFRKEKHWQRKRELNTNAYFLFLFSRLEHHIKSESGELLRQKISGTLHWKTKAIWKTTEGQDLHFLKRTGLLTEAGQLDHSLVVDYYKRRNTIAHGGTIPGGSLAIEMIDVFTNMKRLQKVLKR